jgi:hypothetical protein
VASCCCCCCCAAPIGLRWWTKMMLSLGLVAPIRVGLVGRYQRAKRTYCLHLQILLNLKLLILNTFDIACQRNTASLSVTSFDNGPLFNRPTPPWLRRLHYISFTWVIWVTYFSHAFDISYWLRVDGILIHIWVSCLIADCYIPQTLGTIFHAYIVLQWAGVAQSV